MFREHDHELTIQYDRKDVNFLDVTYENIYRPYQEDNIEIT